MAFSDKGGPRSFLVEGCPGRAATRTAIQAHFIHRNVLDTVITLEEVNLPHLRCPRCNIMVTCRTLNGRHTVTAQCAWGEERKIRRLSEEELRKSTERDFQTYGEPL